MNSYQEPKERVQLQPLRHVPSELNEVNRQSVLLGRPQLDKLAVRHPGVQPHSHSISLEQVLDTLHTLCDDIAVIKLYPRSKGGCSGDRLKDREELTCVPPKHPKKILT